MKRLANFYALFLALLGACLTLPLMTALIFGERSSVRAFGIVMTACFIIGGGVHFACRGRMSEMKVKQRESYFLVASSWMIASLVGCLPYILTGAIPDFFGAFFETCSGFTTTGSTVIDDIETLPRSILLWRSLTQWLGGMGIIVLFVALLPRFGIKARNIASAETPGPTVTKLTSRFTGTAQRLYVAYIILTALEAMLLMGGGMSFYDAVNHAFTTMATGGFSTYGDSIAHFGSDYIIWVITFFMFLAGTNFELFFVAAGGHPLRALRNEEFGLYVRILFISIAAVTASLMLHGGYADLYTAVKDSSFQVITIMTTTGYATANYDLWPAFCRMILLALMVIGGSSSSTAGGVKVVRIMVLFRMIRREINIKLHGNIVNDVSLGDQKLLPETMTHIIGFVTLYTLTLMTGTFLISVTGQGDPLTNFTAVLTCISNVGPGLDGVGPAATFSFYDSFCKFVLSLVMVAGRLELSTFFIMFSRFFWDPNRV